MIPSFHAVDRPTHRRVMVVGLLLCLGFVVISFSLWRQAEDGRVVVEADKLVRTAGDPHKANRRGVPATLSGLEISRPAICDTSRRQ